MALAGLAFLVAWPIAFGLSLCLPEWLCVATLTGAPVVLTHHLYRILSVASSGHIIDSGEIAWAQLEILGWTGLFASLFASWIGVVVTRIAPFVASKLGY